MLEMQVLVEAAGLDWDEIVREAMAKMDAEKNAE